MKLSYPLTTKSPLYPSTPSVTLQNYRSQKKGDSANTSVISVSSHSGTHIDVPLHFCPEGSSVQDLLQEENFFFPTYCLDIKKEHNECISVEDLRPFISSFSDARALLIKTGWFLYRNNDPDLYIHQNPWIDEAVPEFLRKHIPSLQLLGVDTISVSNTLNREHGRACHRSFLCEEKPIMLLEDLDLSKFDHVRKKFTLCVYPWLVDTLDGVPVMVFAKV